MSQLIFTDLIETPDPLSPPDAVALTLAVGDAVAERGLMAVPPASTILLSSTGEVSIEGISESDAEPIERSLEAQLALLTRSLLQLDYRGPVERRRRVPAQLLAVLARALTRVDVPALEPKEFREALERFGRPDATMLAAVFWRAARVSPPARPQAGTPAPSRMESAVAQQSLEDRRQNQPAPSDLRRYLREAERQLFEARGHAAETEPAPTVSPAAAEPVARNRFWRIAAGVAATTVGAVVGTALAFMLAGDSVAPSDPAAADRSASRAAASAADGASSGERRPIRIERTVQPMLLAAAIGSDVFSPSFAPRGRTILFHAGREASPLMRASVSDNGEVDHIETLLDDGAANYHVTMSPDGSRIAYDSDRDGVRGVYVANADGSGSRRISGAGYSAVPSWSPDGSQVAFVRGEPGRLRVWNIWLAEVPSGQLRRVTNHDVGQPWGASWFPDGQHIAYSLEDRLMVADLRDGLARGYRSPRAGRLVRTPAVSPDGRQIVFQVQRDGVWLLDVEHARMRRILHDETAEEFVWEPDGRAIAYHARKGGSYGLWRLALNPAAN